MTVVPDETRQRRDEYCRARSLAVEDEDLRWWGLDAFLWPTTSDTVLKIHRHSKEFRQELAVYQRLQGHAVERLQGFWIPILLNYDESLLVLELSYVKPPYILDFAHATLDQPPSGFEPESHEWIMKGKKTFGRRWPEVQRLLDALLHLGVYYTDIHRQNIRFS